MIESSNQVVVAMSFTPGSNTNAPITHSVCGVRVYDHKLSSKPNCSLHYCFKTGRSKIPLRDLHMNTVIYVALAVKVVSTLHVPPLFVQRWERTQTGKALPLPGKTT
jgi:hypothetical protein